MKKVLALTSQELSSIPFSLEGSHLFTYYFPSFPRGDEGCQRMFMVLFDGLSQLLVLADKFSSEEGERSGLSVCIGGKLVCFDNPETFKHALLVNMDRKAQILNVVSNTNHISSPCSFMDYFSPKSLQRSDSLTSVSTLASSVCEGETMVRSRSLTCLQDMWSMMGLSNPGGDGTIIDSSLLSQTGLSSDGISEIQSWSYFDEQAFMKSLIVFLNTSQGPAYVASGGTAHPHFRVMASLLALNTSGALSFEPGEAPFLKDGLINIFNDVYLLYRDLNKRQLGVETQQLILENLLDVGSFLADQFGNFIDMDLFRCHTLSYYFNEAILVSLIASMKSGLYSDDGKSLKQSLLKAFEAYIDPKQTMYISGRTQVGVGPSRFDIQFGERNPEGVKALQHIQDVLRVQCSGKQCPDFRALLLYVKSSYCP